MDASTGTTVLDMRYGSYEDPKVFGPYCVLLLFLDFLFNWIVDWAHSDPLALLVIFVFQSLGLVVNLIVYIMASGSQAMQSGLKRSLIYHHQTHLITSLIYISLTCTWYIWALRKSWPSVSDQFSFAFGSDYATTVTAATTLASTTASPNTTIITSLLNSTMMMTNAPNLTVTGDLSATAESTTMIPIMSILANNATTVSFTGGSSPANSSTISKFFRTFTFFRNLFPTKSSKKTEGMGQGMGKVGNNVYTLWSSGFIALYVIQRTASIIYYFMSLKATFLVLNSSTIDKLEERRKRVPSKPLGNRSRRISSDLRNQREEIPSNQDLVLERRLQVLRNFRDVTQSNKQKTSPKLRSALLNILEKKKNSGSN